MQHVRALWRRPLCTAPVGAGARMNPLARKPGRTLSRAEESALARHIEEHERVAIAIAYEAGIDVPEPRRVDELPRAQTSGLVTLIERTLAQEPESIVAELRDELASSCSRVRRDKGRMLEANIGLVVSMALRHRHFDVPLADLIQEGHIGLLNAIDRFDHRVGVRFSTYAAWWVRDALQRALERQAQVVRTPRHRIARRSRTARAHSQLYASLDREPTAEEVADAMALGLDETIDDLGSGVHVVSLDTPLHAGGRLCLAEEIADATNTPADDDVARRDQRSRLRELLGVLPTRERAIVVLRYGIDRPPHTLQAIADELGLTRERIRQLEAAALNKLRRAWQRQQPAMSA